MAEFNPEVQYGNIPDWTNAPGRLIDQSGFGELFAKSVTSASVAATDYMDSNATKDISNTANKAWEDATVADAANKAGLPPEVAKSMDRMTLWQKAVEKGGISRTNAYAQMEAEMKKLQAKYPQRADEIQQAYAKATGNTAANDLYNSVATDWTKLNEANSKTSDDLQKQFDKYAPWMDEGDPAKFFASTPDERARMVNSAVSREQQKNKIDLVQNQLALKKANKENITDEAKPAFVQAVDTNVALVFRGGEKKILQMIKDAQADKNISQDEQLAITNAIEEAKVRLNSTFDGMLMTPFGNGSQQTTWNQIFASDPTIIDDQRKRIASYTETLNGLITNPQNTGVAQWTATVLGAQDRDFQAAFLKTGLGQQYDRMKNIAEVGGKPLEDYFKTNIPTILDSLDAENVKNGKDSSQATIAKVVAGQMTMDMLQGDKTLSQSITEGTKGATEKEKAAANPAIRATIESTLKTIADPNADPAVWDKAANFLFADGNEDFFAKLSTKENQYGVSQQELAFQAFTNPKVAAAFKARGKEKQYYEAVLTWSQPVLGSLPEDLKGRAGIVSGTGNIGSKVSTADFNPETMQIEFRIDPKKVGNMSGLRLYLAGGDKAISIREVQKQTGLSVDEVQNLYAMGKATQRINLVMKAQADALAAQGMPKEKIIQYLAANLGDINPGKQAPLLDNIIPMVVDYAKKQFAENTDGTVNKRLQKEQYGDNFGQNPDGGNTQLNVLEASGGTGTQPDTGDETANKVLSFIHKAEGADYNTVYGGGKVDAASMTVQDVLDRKDNAGSSAFGAVQVMKKTLKALVDKGVVSPDQPMDQVTQDKIGMALLQDAGYDGWKSGKISTKEFANALSKIWASLPGIDGKSAYEGDGVNKATVSRTELVGMLADLR